MLELFCNFAIANRKYGLPKESAFSPYSDCVNLNNLHIICEVWNIGVTRCSIGLYVYYILSLWSNSEHLYFYFAGKSRPLHRKIETKWIGSTFFVLLTCIVSVQKNE